MKRLVCLAVLGLLSTPAFAQSTSSSGAMSNSGVNYSPTNIAIPSKRLDTTANAFAPSLTAGGVDACAGSWGVGVGITGLGLSGGSTYELKGCTTRANAAALNAVGGRATAAYYLASQDEGMRQALIATGVLAAPPSEIAAKTASRYVAEQRVIKSGFCSNPQTYNASLCAGK